MASKRGQKWTTDKGEKALAEHYYIKVADKGGKLQLSGAGKRFEENPEFIYVPAPYRVAGERADIRDLFLGLEVAADDVERILDTGYTASNHATNAQYKAELAADKAWKSSQPKTTAAAPKHTLADIEGILRLNRSPAAAKAEKVPAVRKPRASASTSTAGASTGASRGGRVRPLADKLAELPEDKVLDVTNMSETGAGVKAINVPKAGNPKVGVVGLRIVSSNPENYYAAIASLGPAYAHYAEAYRNRSAVPAPPAAAVTEPATETVEVPAPAPVAATIPAPAKKAAIPKLATTMPTKLALPVVAGK